MRSLTQGGLETLRQMVGYLSRDIPVISVHESGGMAFLLKTFYHHLIVSLLLTTIIAAQNEVIIECAGYIYWQLFLRSLYTYEIKGKLNEMSIHGAHLILSYVCNFCMGAEISPMLIRLCKVGNKQLRTQSVSKPDNLLSN